MVTMVGEVAVHKVGVAKVAWLNIVLGTGVIESVAGV